MGNWGTLLLPLNHDDSIDWVLLEEEVEIMAAAGVNGIYSNGTAGEFFNQTEDEFDRIQLILAQTCERHGVAFQVGVSHMSPILSLERLKRIKALRPGAVQVILPDWFPVSEPERVDFLKRMEEEAHPVGLVLYNPPHAKRVLSPKELETLHREVPNLVGIKVAGGDDRWYSAMKSLMTQISVFVPGHFLATGYSRGAAGSYSNVACLHPGGAQRWYEQMKADLPAALDLETRIQTFMSRFVAPYITEKSYMNGAVDKMLCVVGGWSGMTPRMRWPHRWIPEAEAPELRRRAAEWVPELLAYWYL